jgi:hypothetical protein
MGLCNWVLVLAQASGALWPAATGTARSVCVLLNKAHRRKLFTDINPTISSIPTSIAAHTVKSAETAVTAGPVPAPGDLASEDTSLPGIQQVASIPRFVDTVSNECDYNAFFSRPITFASVTWTSATTGASLGSLYAYLNDQTILRKVIGYSRMRFTLNVRFEFHPTAFHFGLLLFGVDYSNSVSGFQTPWSNGYRARLLMNGPHVFLNAAAPAVMDLQVPFSQGLNYLPLDMASTITATVGTAFSPPVLGYYAVAPLGFSNAAAVPDVVVTIRVWLTDVELTGPTSFTPFSQSGKGRVSELGSTGPVSTTFAAAGAGLAAAAERAPFLGSFLKPFHAIAYLGESVSSLLGFSSPPDVRTPAPVVSRPASSYAVTDAANSAQPLFLNSTAGFTPSTDNLGLAGEDEMALSTWTQRSGHLVAFTWALSDIIAAAIFYIPVSPRFVSYDGTTYISPHPLWYATAPFTKWRGSIIYTFTAVASPQHRGRLRILYDPTTLSTGIGAGESVGHKFNCVLDLEAARSIDVCVAWNSEYTWLSHNMGSSLATGASAGSPCAAAATGSAIARLEDNGGLVVFVEAPLTAPQATNNDITIQVSIRGGPDYMVAGPDAYYLQYWTPITNQAGRGKLSTTAVASTQSDLRVGPQICYINGAPGPVNANAPLVSMGESPVSLRSLVKRYCIYKDVTPTTAITSAAYTYTTLRHSACPAGWWVKDVFENDTAGGHPSVTYLTWFMMGYRLMRGSVRWRVVVVPVYLDDGTKNYSLVMNFPRLWGYAIARATATGASTAIPRLTLCQFDSGAAAGSTVDGVLDISVPILCPLNGINPRYFGQVTPASLGNVAPQPWGYAMEGSMITNTRAVSNVFVAAGDDFTLAGYVGPPALKVRATIT